MVSGATLIEKLLSYAADNLYLAPADEYFKRVVLCKLMNVDPRSVTEKRHAGVGLSAVKAELDAYATENKLNADGDLSLLIFGCLTPLNSSIEKSFKLFREKFSASKAREYYFGLMKNCGYVSERDFSPVLGRHGKINLCTANGFVVKESAYRPDERYVRLNLVRDYLFGYDKYYDFAEQGNLIIADGVKFSSEEDGLDDIFEFIDYMPDYCVYAGRSEVGANAERLTTFKERPSALDAEVRFSFRHEAYPDVEVGAVDWPIPDLRFMGYNKNTLISLINHTANSWLRYDVASGTGSGAVGNFVQIILYLLPDGRYAADMLLRSGDRIKFNKKLSKLLVNKDDHSAAYGKFIFDKRLDKLLFSACKVLTGKAKYDPFELGAAENELFPVSDLITEVITAGGTLKDSSKAEAALFDALTDHAMTALKSANPFKDDHSAALKLKMFLLSIDVKQV